MSLPSHEVAAIAESVISSLHDEVRILGISSSEGGSDRVELLITIHGCHDDPCRILVNLNRANSVQFEQDLRAKLHEALLEHK